MLAGGAGFLVLGGTLGGIFAALGVVLGGIMLILGLFQLFVAWGLWTGRKWAWILALIFGVLGVIFAIINLPSGIISLLINGVIIYYLFTPQVKAFFGR